MSKPSDARSVMFLYAVTPLHAGSGTLIHGGVDLPIQRDRTTNHPIIQASSVKGALKSISLPKDKALTEILFGQDPQPGEAPQYAGALSLTDARILLFPIRSLKGIFAWTTCPLILERFARDCSLLGTGNSFPRRPEDTPAVAKDSELLVDGESVVVEEYRFPRVKSTKETDDLGQWFANHALPQSDAWKSFRQLLPKRLIVLGDNDFQHFAETGTVVLQRVALDPATKTVKNGALWSEEHLPPESLLYSLAMVQPQRRPNAGTQVALEPEKGLGFLKGVCAQPVQMGGDETVGRGIIAIRFHP